MRFQVRAKVRTLRGATFTVKDRVLTEVEGADAQEAGLKARRLWPTTEFVLVRVPESAEVSS